MADGLQDFFCACFLRNVRLIFQLDRRSADAEIKADNKLSKPQSIINFINFRFSL